MAEPTWQDLLRCYDNVEFLDGGRGILTVATDEILNTVRAIDADEAAASDLILPAMSIRQRSGTRSRYALECRSCRSASWLGISMIFCRRPGDLSNFHCGSTLLTTA